jgi:hypothetical protein
MSNFLAIATVTAALAQLLQSHIGDDVAGAIVTNVRPDSNGNGTPTTGVNLYLYQVTPNAHWRNHDVPTRSMNGGLVQRPRIALDLYYLLTFYGDDTQWETQRILGNAVRTLHYQPQLTKRNIEDALNANAILALSNLGEETEMVKLTPIPLSLEELSKLWSVFFQIPYTLSLAYQATVIFIEGEDTPQPALPVRQRNIYIRPFQQPEISEVVNQAGTQEPLVAGSTLLIRGRRLQGEDTRLRVAGEDVTPANITNTEMILPLIEPPFAAATLRAGIQGVQVVQRLLMGTPPTPHTGVESNIMPFVIHPTITNVTADNIQNEPNNTHAADLIVTVAPSIGKKQRVVLLLNENVSQNAAAYRFVAAKPDTTMSEIAIPIHGVKAGTYLVRLQVDGADSLLAGSGDPENPMLTGPEVTLP